MRFAGELTFIQDQKKNFLEKVLNKNVEILQELKKQRKRTRIISAMVGVRFEDGEKLSNILNALECTNNGEKLVLEVAQHFQNVFVRFLAMDSTGGLVGRSVVRYWQTYTKF